ncbi:MAG: DUF5309 family protein [Alistipes sp.]|nr:DUF5309 family protein [Alistipes sp.]
MKKTMKILSGLTVVIAAVVAVLGVLGIVDIESALGAGAMMAVAPVGFVGADADSTTVGSAPTAGGKEVTTGKSGLSPEDKPQMNKATVSEKLSKIEPSRTPLDTLLRNIGSGKTNSDVFEFYSIHSRGLSATIGSSADPTGNIIKITLSDGCHCLSKDANVFIPQLQVEGSAVNTANPIATNPLRLHIVDINYGAGTIDVVVTSKGISAATAKAKLTSGVVLRRMASAKDQEAAISNDPMATPVKEKNFCQRNLCTISQNVYQALQDKEVEYGIAEFKEQALLDFRAQAEYAALFGEAPADDGAIIDPNTQKRKLFMRGLLSFDILKYIQGDESVEEYINIAMQKAFENNNGSEKRLLLYGPEFATALANSGVWTRQLEAGKTEVKWGITWKVIESNFGTLMAIMHPGLGVAGYGKAAFLIDPANIRRIEQVPLTMENLDLKKAGIRNSEDVLLEEAFTLEVTNPKTHGFLCLK